MGKKGKRGNKPSEKKAVLKRLDALAKKLEEELEGADLFAPLPPTEDCPICLVRLPRVKRVNYQGCCGKKICQACYTDNALINAKASAKKSGKTLDSLVEGGGAWLTCPFCRATDQIGKKSREYIRQLEFRTSQGDSFACSILGDVYENGKFEAPIDLIKSLHYYILAVELGSEAACGNIALLLEVGTVVPAIDKSKSALFYKIGALRGHMLSRLGIAMTEYKLGNNEAGIRHWKIAAEAGMQPALDKLEEILNEKLPGKEFISKEELDNLHRMCHKAQEEVKTDEREKYLSKEAEVRTWTKC